MRLLLAATGPNLRSSRAELKRIARDSLQTGAGAPIHRCFESTTAATHIPDGFSPFSSLVSDSFSRNSRAAQALIYVVTTIGKGIMTTRFTWPSWQPPEEALENIAAAIASHWNAAKAYRERLFWPSAESWLRPAYHFTRGGKLIK
jgi:hypothetical protein